MIFYGMAGGGKTSCALELAYRFVGAKRFRGFVYFAAPKQGDDIALALRDFALALEKQIPHVLQGHTLVDVLDREDEFQRRLLLLAALLARTSVLVVVDNIESLLTPDARWRDARWDKLLTTLFRPTGLSRIVLTSRIRPDGLPPSIQGISVHALSLAEAALLVSELPNLKRLVHGHAPQRKLVRAMLRLVQGHPMLIAFAEALAADPARLLAQLERAAVVQNDGELDAFFEIGETHYGPEAFLQTLRRWASDIARTLPDPSRMFFLFLCALEEADREGQVIENNWPDVWDRLRKPGAAPRVETVLEPLLDAGLVDRQRIHKGRDFVVMVHPGVAEQGRSEADVGIWETVATELSNFWHVIMGQSLEEYGTDHRLTRQIIRAGISGFAYHSRLGRWQLAMQELQQVLRTDQSPATLAAILPLMRRCANALAGTAHELEAQTLVASVLRRSGQTKESERLLRQLKLEAEERKEFQILHSLCGELRSLLVNSGRFEQALTLADEHLAAARRAGLGPWTLLGDQVERLRLLQRQGRDKDVLNEVTALLDEMTQLERPLMTDPAEAVSAWEVHELALAIGRETAIRLLNWTLALQLSREIAVSEQQRGAPLLEQARSRFNEYASLLMLERYSEVQRLLDLCQEVAEKESALDFLANVFSARASLEYKLGRFTKAVEHLKVALRYAYVVNAVYAIGMNHFNLASYLVTSNGEKVDAFAHRLAAVLLQTLTGDRKDEDFPFLVRHLRQLGKAKTTVIPQNFAELCATLERVDGVRFRDLVLTLLPDDMTADRALQTVLAHAVSVERTRKYWPFGRL